MPAASKRCSLLLTRQHSHGSRISRSRPLELGDQYSENLLQSIAFQDPFSRPKARLAKPRAIGNELLEPIAEPLFPRTFVEPAEVQREIAIGVDGAQGPLCKL
jgi:hypothetical protein